MYPATLPDESARVVLLVGAYGLTLMAGGVWLGSVGAIAVGFAVLVGEYGLALIGRSTIDPWAIAYVPALMTSLQLLTTALERLRGLPRWSKWRITDVSALGIVVAGTAVPSATILVVAASPLDQGILGQAAAVGAATAIIVVLAVLTRIRSR